MKLNRILLCLFSLFLFFSASAGPARNIAYTITQPDGTVFTSRIRGDEWIRIKTTADGHAIIQDPDGWWSYAVYDDDGRKYSTGCHVGKPVASDILSRSRDIPYSALQQNSLSSDRRRTSARNALAGRLYRDDAVTRGDGAERRCLVILVEYQDIRFQNTRQDFDDLVNKKGYDVNGAAGSATDYFNAQFGGNFDIIFDVTEIVTLPYERKYYGGNIEDGSGNETDKAPEDMVLHACRQLDESMDFSKYDYDGDGAVDFIYIFYAGGGEAEYFGDDAVWAHQWSLYSGAGKEFRCDGKLIDTYACSPELMKTVQNDIQMSAIGTFCHEFSHILGLYDMYDTDYEGSGGITFGLGRTTCIMDGGNYNNDSRTPPFYNAVDRELAGLLKPEVITSNGTYVLEPIGHSGKAYRLNTDCEDEYYLIECRSNEQWDKYIGGSGLVVYHIDKSQRDAGFSDLYQMNLSASDRWYYNEVNCRPDHCCAYMVPSVSGSDDIRSFFYPIGDYNSIPAENLSYWSGEMGTVSIENIRRSEDKVMFTVLGFEGGIVPPEPVKISYERFQDAAVVMFESSEPFDGEAVVNWGKTGKEAETVIITPYESGKYALVMDGLTPKTSYTVTMSFSAEGVLGKEGSISFMTTSSAAGGYPYIYLKNVQRNPDGSFPSGSRLPLRVYNSVGAERVDWTLGGQKISIDDSGYYIVNKSGTLRAEVYWEDGSKDVIVKEVIVKDIEQ